MDTESQVIQEQMRQTRASLADKLEALENHIVDSARDATSAVNKTVQTVTQTVQGGQSPFAIVVDGVAEPGQEFLKQQLIDVQQIEVLRGPQGTLYGAGAVAGAINIVTKQPTDEFEASAKVGYAQGNQSTGLVTVSGPIVNEPDLIDALNDLVMDPLLRESEGFRGLARERRFTRMAWQRLADPGAASEPTPRCATPGSCVPS